MVRTTMNGQKTYTRKLKIFCLWYIMKKKKPCDGKEGCGLGENLGPDSTKLLIKLYVKTCIILVASQVVCKNLIK